MTGRLIGCPVCGTNVVDHCKMRDCTWWRCPNRNCNSFGYDAERFVDASKRSS